jgi:predicted transcriptional regulator
MNRKTILFSTGPTSEQILGADHRQLLSLLFVQKVQIKVAARRQDIAIRTVWRRLRVLIEAGHVVREDRTYLLTAAGRAFLARD